MARDLRLLWVACGTSDHLITPSRDFVTWAKQKKLPVTPIETPGKHTWLVWRDNLIHYTPLLFRNRSEAEQIRFNQKSESSFLAL